MQFATDTATLALFDPELLADRVRDASGWWCVDFLSLERVVRGDIALIGLGGDGVFKVRMTNGELTSSERAYAADFVPLGVRVTSGLLFVGPGEHLPGEGFLPQPGDRETAALFCPVNTDTYSAEVYGIVWHDAPDWYVAPGAEVPESAPPDVVVRLTPREGEFVPPTTEPRIFVETADRWIFPEEPRRLGPVPGMTLRTRVVRRRDDLVLKPCGPRDYRPILKTTTDLDWNDEIDVRVVAVNHETREFEAELVKGSQHGRPDPGSPT